MWLTLEPVPDYMLEDNVHVCNGCAQCHLEHEDFEDWCELCVEEQEGMEGL